MYQQLDSTQLLDTLDHLVHRIDERFPDCSLKRVAIEVRSLAEDVTKNIEWIKRPNWWLRGSLVVVIAAIIIVLITTLAGFKVETTGMTFVDAITTAESAINDVILIAAALFFLVSVETRIKRARAQKILHQLRAITHVIDMHQLTKDPSVICPEFGEFTPTESSPKRSMSEFELQRYLDYSAEMLSLVAKIAALYVQDFPDEVVTQTVNDIEILCDSLSRKIWQKIALLKD